MPLTAGTRLGPYEVLLSPDGKRIAFRSEREGGGILIRGTA